MEELEKRALKGDELLKKRMLLEKELDYDRKKDGSMGPKQTSIIRACGYFEIDKEGNEEILYTYFYSEVLRAKGLTGKGLGTFDEEPNLSEEKDEEDVCKDISPKGKYKYYFNLSQGLGKPRVMILQQDFIRVNANGEEIFNGGEVITYSVCYGYSGGGIQGDFLFKQDFTEGGIISYCDCSGGQWNGARTYSSQTNTYSDEVQCPTWDDLDQKAYTYLMDNWSKFFQDHPNGVDFIPNKDLIKSTDFTGVFSSKDFDEDCLYDFTGIWNFLTLYQLEE